MNLRVASLAGVAIATLVACTENVQLAAALDGGALPGLLSLDVTPADTTLELDDLAAPPQTIAYTATGHFVDGDTRDVTALVRWTTDNDAPGRFAVAGSYTTSNAAAGHVAIHAASGDILGAAALTVIVSQTVVDGAFPPPAGTPELFAPGTPVVVADPTRSPTLLYPSDRTMFPQGLAHILFQYQRGSGNDAFRLAFDSDVLHLVVFTSGDRWQPDESTWSLLALSNRGSTTSLSVQAVAAASPGSVYATMPVTLSFAREAPGGILYFWSDASKGIMRGRISATSAAKLYAPPGDKTCVGCHAVSRDGTKLAFGYGGEVLETLDVGSVSPMITVAASVDMGWATFSPDGALVLVANKGELRLLDAATADPVGSPDGRVKLPPGTRATHPDWSPDGTYVAVALGSTVGNMDMKGGRIAKIAYAGGAWSDPEVLVDSTADDDNNYFPRWSPDGRYLAYVHADSASRGARTAELRLIPAAGGTPIRLRAASHRVAGIDDVPDLANTTPVWAPVQGQLAWLAFATARPYGAVAPAGSPSQVWIAGLDLARADAGEDPSFAAFWLPCQDVTVLNNNPVWSPEPPPQ